MTGKRTERPAFGALLRRHRIAAGLSQEMLAERSRISVQAVSALERGARSAPRPDTLALLLETLDLQGAERAEFEDTARASVKVRVRGEPSRERRPETASAFDGPHFSTQFIGRHGEMRELETLVERGRCTTLWGPGGVGKTRLAVELANARDVRGESVAFVALASTTDGESVDAAVAAGLGVTVGPGKDVLTQIVTAFADRSGLIVFDNCEQVIDAVARIVERLLARLPAFAILCTSREPLRIGGEHVFHVRTLDLDDSVRLFLDRAAAASAAREPSIAELRSVQTICRRLDGLPLSLELAAACTRALDVANIERALDERFDLLTRGSRTAAARHLTLRATIAWSYDLLEAHERLVFDRLAIINGRFTFEDALAVAADDTIERGFATAALAALVDKALVTLDAVPGATERSYRLLESTRAFAAQVAPDAAARPQLDAARRRLGAHLTQRAIRASELSRGGDDAAIRSLEPDVLRGYLHWALVDRRDPAPGTLLAGRLMIFWDLTGGHLEGLRWIELGLEQIDRDATDPIPELAALIGTARLQQRLSRFVESLVYAERAYDRAKAAGDVAYQAAAAYLLGVAHTILGDHDRAFAYVEEALSMYEAAGDDLGCANARDVAAMVAFRSGRVAKGRDLYRHGIELHQASGRRRSAAANMMDLAEAEFALENATDAIDLVRAGIDEMREVGTELIVAFGLANESAYLLEAGRTGEALDGAREALRLAIDGGFEQCLILCFQLFAAVAAASGRAVSDAAALSAYITIAMERTFPELGYTEARVRDKLRSALAGKLSDEEVVEAEARGAALDEDAAIDLAWTLDDATFGLGRRSSGSSDVA